MKQRFRALLPWLAGAVMAAGLFAAVQVFSYIRFENSDDVLIVKAFMGFEGGVPARFNLYIHTVAAHALAWLSTAVPGVAWFSLWQLCCLLLSLTVLGKCAVQVAASRRLPLWAGFAAGLLLVGCVGLFACARVNFTTTAALLGAAGLAQLCTLAHGGKRPLGAALLSAALVLMAYVLRPQSLLALAPLFLLALGWVLLRRREAGAALRPVALAMAVGCLALCALAGVRAWELRDPALRDLMAFQEANVEAMDYNEDLLLSVPDETLDAIGWSRDELALVQQWYFMDENITAEAFRVLSGALPQRTLWQRVGDAVGKLGAFFAATPRYVLWLAALGLLAALCAVLPGRYARWAALLALLATVGMLGYLAFAGRFLSRAADCALFPATALLALLALDGLCGLPRGTGRRLTALCLCALALVALGGYGLGTVRVLGDRPDRVSAQREADLETQALLEPDVLFVRTPNLLRDTRILPRVPDGVPGNILIWGDWYCRTPSWYGQLALYGFDGQHFTGADFLSPNLRFVTAGDPPQDELVRYISAAAGREVRAVQEGTRGDLAFWRFE